MGNEVPHMPPPVPDHDGEETPLTPTGQGNNKPQFNIPVPVRQMESFPDIHDLEQITPPVHCHDASNNKPHIVKLEAHKIPNQLTDCWDIEDPKDDPFIAVSHTVPNAIYLKPRNKRKQTWISVFGTKIGAKSEYKRWHIKILPNPEATSDLKANDIHKTAKLMIGVIDMASLGEKQRGVSIQSEFWLPPHFGYAFGGEKGRKYHKDSKGTPYNNKYKIGDTITVVLNRKSNNVTTHNDLQFYTNDIVHGTAFHVDIGRSYVLAVALYEDSYQIQIAD